MGKEYQTRWEKSPSHVSPDIGKHHDWDLRARDEIGRKITDIVHLRVKEEE
ncbi:hypothetical protein Shell_0182 [Staphylothermus hellenicus DSM 12710]|uniref:Uncharacterized protein n=1 Tax=Staphylothermus hellenicus (strain DSM 12710 / JCM 10830 / BK20S6-10-b1 / P8) TaxID=591019 RepID=D7DAX8_STAHD|nr:hypothetical protein Shell_0182 [Staphylothermus hellenicus DSM 12710]